MKNWPCHAIFLFVLAALHAGADPAPDWPTYHGGHDLCGTTAASLPAPAAIAWQFRADGAIEQPPVAGDGRVFFTTAKGTVYALTTNGAALWTRALGDTNSAVTFSAPPLLATPSILVLGANDGRLFGLEARTGDTRWTYAAGNRILGAPNALAGDEPSAIVVSQVDGVAHRVRLRDGAAVWKSAPIGRTDGSPAVNHGRIVYGSCASSLHVIAEDDARILAEIPLCDDCQVAGGVALHGDRAFSGSRSGRLFAVDLQAPAIAWTNAVTTGEVFSTPAVDDGLALFGSNDGTLFALDPSTGATVWTFAAGQAVSSPLLAAERVAFSAGGTLYVLARATGALLWSQAVSDRITAPAVAAGLLLVGADEGTLTAFGAPP